MKLISNFERRFALFVNNNKIWFNFLFKSFDFMYYIELNWFIFTRFCSVESFLMKLRLLDRWALCITALHFIWLIFLESFEKIFTSFSQIKWSFDAVEYFNAFAVLYVPIFLRVKVLIKLNLRFSIFGENYYLLEMIL